MKKLSILFTGAALCLLLAFPIVIYAQNHNPEFEVSNLSFSGSNYIFIGDDDGVMGPRTEITLRYRDGGDAPEDGTTTLEWVTDGGADDGSTRVLAFDAEDTVTGGFTDGDGDQSTTGPWYWTGGDAQESYPGNALYLQGVADTLDAEGNVTNSYSGNTVKLKASHSDSSNVPFDKEFDLINKPDLSVTDPAGVEVQEQDEEDPGMVIASADENGNFNTRLIAKAVDAGGNYRIRLSQDIPLYSDSSGSNSVTLTASNSEYVTAEFDASSDTTYYVSPPENVTGVITAELDWWEDGEPVTNQPTIEGADTVTLLKVDFETFPDDETREIGGSRSPNWKAHKLNLDTKQNESDHYGDFEKCVAHIWTDQPLNLAKYLSDYESNQEVFENPDVLNWNVNGQLQTSYELNLETSAPNENQYEPYKIEVLTPGSSEPIDRLIVTVVPPETLTNFDQWVADNQYLGWLAELPALYSTVLLDENLEAMNPEPSNIGCSNWKDNAPFKPWFDMGADTYYHPDAYHEIRSEETPGGHGHQACYSYAGVLIRSGVSAGTADRSFYGNTSSEDGHVTLDTRPFVWAVQLDRTPADGIVTFGFNYTKMDNPIMHEGQFIGEYIDLRPPIANDRAELLPLNCP